MRERRGGWSVAVRAVLDLEDGRRVFPKLGDVPDTQRAIREEIGVYEVLGPRPFLPRLLSADLTVPVLVLESLEDAVWPPPWSEASLRALDRLCDEIAATPGPVGLPTVTSWVARERGWRQVADDPEPLVRTGLVSERWLAAHVPTLAAAAASAPTEGTSLQHGDLRSDNLAVRGDRGIAVDWNGAMRGDARWDRMCLVHTLQMEGVGTVDDLAPDADPAIIAWVAGFFAARAGLPPPEGAPRVRPFQRAQLKVVLPWTCRLLGLAPPEPGHPPGPY